MSLDNFLLYPIVGIIHVFLAALFIGGLALAMSEGLLVWNLVGVLMLCLFSFIANRCYRFLKRGGS